ncbi:MAG: phosphoribosylamine--glycine ligase [Gammaproteobacteria bacterium]|nr:phosphoribosylamine--glycine ligase [Gammaproteobacteria bacterium]MYF60349.1 phosphoribosylamine--glycine ligase [Gammaproteobacteria bacterium]MYI22637.1 phosphoribosylamine--glycine ligase [Gammaproteobacteria bacterium]
MRILIVGNGGREHALLWKLRRDAPAAGFFATRPNAGMAGMARAVDISPTDVEALTSWAESHRMDLVVIGPEVPLALGLADRLEAAGVPAFGPSRAAARIESSKAFAKDLMSAAGVPTADYRVFTDAARAEAHVMEGGGPCVVKASGLAAGKGAIVCDDPEEACVAIRQMLVEGGMGDAGREVVIEERMTGEELSVFALADGERAVPLVASQDHKRIGEGDTGPNTGGMGAYAPVSLATDNLIARVGDQILDPVLQALAEAGCPFRGLLYAGLMLADEGPRVVEFNCRFGDPETQVVLPLLEGSLLDPMMAIADGSGLAGYRAGTAGGAAVTTVLAAEGYPGSYRTGAALEIPESLADDPDVLLFHAGTRHHEGAVLTAGGRVLAATGLGRTLAEAAERSRSAAREIGFEGRYFRSDIGWRELARS